jgi:hypothetical protein
LCGLGFFAVKSFEAFNRKEREEPPQKVAKKVAVSADKLF